MAGHTNEPFKRLDTEEIRRRIEGKAKPEPKPKQKPQPKTITEMAESIAPVVSKHSVTDLKKMLIDGGASNKDAIAAVAKARSGSFAVASRAIQQEPGHTPDQEPSDFDISAFDAMLEDMAAQQYTVTPTPKLQIHDAGVWLMEEQPEIEQVFPDLFDKGAKMLINGNSKARKTFVMLQMAISIATGRPFLRWEPCRPMKCFVLQGEVPDGHFHARLLRACKCMDINPASLKGMLKVVNTRGHKFTLDDPPQWLIEEASDTDVLFVDPVYKFFDGEENSGSDAAKFLAGLDKLTVQSGASIVYVHHAAKGTAGDRQTIDRGSGSGVFARDFDCALFLSPHKDEQDTLVMEPIIRAYKPVEKFCIRFEEGVFAESDHIPMVQTSQNTKQSARPEYLFSTIRSVLEDGDQIKSRLQDIMRDQYGASKNAHQRAVRMMIERNEIIEEPGGYCNSRLLHLNERYQAS